MLTVADMGSFEGTPQELAQLVFDQVTTYPDTHDQLNWVSDCGTTACVAGWTLLFRDGEIPFEMSVEEAARSALGLSVYDAARLFYYTTNEQAKYALKSVANGEAIDWGTVGHKYTDDATLERQMEIHMAFRSNMS